MEEIMALDAYLKIKGAVQGEIKGDVRERSREESIRVTAVSHEVLAFTDARSGLPTGRRQHKPLVITKEVDTSSPQLYSMLANNEITTEWLLRFWRLSASGRELQYYTVELLNARIVEIRFEMPNNRYPENLQLKEREHVSFCYQKITWRFEDGGITAEDDWETP
jgi:type VI secretion system secreted protein Hcp